MTPRVHLLLEQQRESSCLHDFVNVGLGRESHDEKRDHFQMLRELEFGSELVSGDVVLGVLDLGAIG